MSPIPTDLPCLRCGYNLRTLSPAAHCPECNLPIADSQTYAAENPATLRRPTRLFTACILLIANELLYFLPILATFLPAKLATHVFDLPSPMSEILFAITSIAHALLVPLVTFLLWTSGPNPTPAARTRRCLWLITIPLYSFLLPLAAGFDLFLNSTDFSISLIPVTPYGLPVPRVFQLDSLLSALNHVLFLFVILGAWLYFSTIARHQRQTFLRHLTTALAAAAFLGAFLLLLLNLLSALTPLSAASFPLPLTITAALLNLAVHFAAALLLFPLFARHAWKARTLLFNE